MTSQLFLKKIIIYQWKPPQLNWWILDIFSIGLLSSYGPNSTLHSGGSRILLRREPTSKKGLFCNFFLPKTAWKWKNLYPGGECARSWISPLDPPMLDTKKNKTKTRGQHCCMENHVNESYIWKIILNYNKIFKIFSISVDFETGYKNYCGYSNISSTLKLFAFSINEFRCKTINLFPVNKLYDKNDKVPYNKAGYCSCI